MNKVSLFIFRFPDKEISSELLNLSKSDLEKLQQISSEKRRREFLYGRLLIAQVLKDHFGIQNPKVYSDRKGKPRVRGLHFSLSHSANCLVLAVSKKNELGVDVELSQDKKHILAISKQYFHPLEHEFVSKDPTQKNFKWLWSLKEAYIKLLSGELNKNTMQIYFDLHKKRLLHVPKGPKLLSFFLIKRFNIALCTKGLVKKNELHLFTVRSKSYSKLKIDVTRLDEK